MANARTERNAGMRFIGSSKKGIALNDRKFNPTSIAPRRAEASRAGAEAVPGCATVRRPVQRRSAMLTARSDICNYLEFIKR